jgi:hypothetical protein
MTKAVTFWPKEESSREFFCFFLESFKTNTVSYSQNNCQHYIRYIYTPTAMYTHRLYQAIINIALCSGEQGSTLHLFPKWINQNHATNGFF